MRERFNAKQQQKILKINVLTHKNLKAGLFCCFFFFLTAKVLNAKNYFSVKKNNQCQKNILTQNKKREINAKDVLAQKK